MFRTIARNTSGLFLLRTTVGTRAQAEALAHRLVDGGLAACVHVTELSSVYRWKGKRTQETEFQVEARTTIGGRNKALDAILAGHPYEEPLVEGWTVSHVPRGYLRWAKEQVG